MNTISIESKESVATEIIDNSPINNLTSGLINELNEFI